MTITPLKDYILLNYDGNASRFARSIRLIDNEGRPRNPTAQAITKWIRQGDRYIHESKTKITIFVKQWELQK